MIKFIKKNSHAILLTSFILLAAISVITFSVILSDTIKQNNANARDLEASYSYMIGKTIPVANTPMEIIEIDCYDAICYCDLASPTLERTSFKIELCEAKLK